MNNQTLIQSLTDNLQPVKPTVSPNVLTTAWLATGIIVLVLISQFVWPVRGDLWQLMSGNIRFVIELVNAAAAIILLALAAFRSAVPGEDDSKPARWGLILTITWILQYVTSFWFPLAADNMPAFKGLCWYFIFGYGLLFFIPAMVMCFRLYPLAPMRTGFYCSMAAGLIPVAYMHIACGLSALHLFGSHILPLVAMVLLANAAMSLALQFFNDK